LLRETQAVISHMRGIRAGSARDFAVGVRRVLGDHQIANDLPVLKHNAAPASRGKTFVMSRQGESRTMGLLDFQQ
jgi:hypothetical protein